MGDEVQSAEQFASFIRSSRWRTYVMSDNPDNPDAGEWVSMTQEAIEATLARLNIGEDDSDYPESKELSEWLNGIRIRETESTA